MASRFRSALVLAVGVMATAGSLATSAQSASTTTRRARAATAVKRPSADLQAVLSAAPAPPAAAADFTSVAASRNTVVAQGAVADVFVKGADGWKSSGPAATVVDPTAAQGGTGVSISNNTVLGGFAAANGRSVEDVFIKPAAGWSGALLPAARLVAPSAATSLINGAIEGRVIAAQTTSPEQPIGPVGVYVKPPGGWSGAVRPRARLVANGAVTGFGVAVSADTIFVSSRAVVYAFNKPKGGWSGTIKPAARLLAAGRVSVAGPTVLVGNAVFSEPDHGWAGSLKPSATIAAPFPPTDQTSSPTTLVTTSVTTPASGCVTGCPARVAAVLKPAHGWTGHLHQTAIINTTSNTGSLALATSGSDLFVTGGENVRVYRLASTG